MIKIKRYKLMGPAIGALGALAGGLAGQAVMGKPQKIGPDTSVPGITKATIQKGNKSDPGLSIAQVDPSGAIDYFKKAANLFNSNAMVGIDLYKGAIQNAIDSINSTTDKSNLELNRIVARGTPASNEYMRMLGLNPPSDLATSGFFDQVKNSGYGDIAEQMAKAEGIADPKQRALAKQNIINQLNTQGSFLTDTEKQNAMQSGMLGVSSPTNVMSVEEFLKSNKMQGAIDNSKFLQYQKGLASGTSTRPEDGGRIPLDVLSPQGQAAYNKYLEDVKSGYAGQQTSAGQQMTAEALAKKQQQAKELADQYASGYAGKLDKGYSGTEITKKLQSTPGYQFQRNMGEQGIARAAAASGMLGSGNTGAALSEFNQNLANNYYQGFLNNLSPLMQSGDNATAAMANNYMSKGGSLAQLYGNMGSGLLSAYQNIGQAYSNAYTNSGSAFLNTALANMTAQNDAIKTKNQQNFDASQNSQRNALQAGYLNLANSQFNYQVGQNQQAGQVFAGGMLGGNNTSYGAGSGWPYFNNNTHAWYL